MRYYKRERRRETDTQTEIDRQRDIKKHSDWRTGRKRKRVVKIVTAEIISFSDK